MKKCKEDGKKNDGGMEEIFQCERKTKQRKKYEETKGDGGKEERCRNEKGDGRKMEGWIQDWR